MNKLVHFVHLGTIPYSDALGIQKKFFEYLVSSKLSGVSDLPNFIFTCEHHPVYTLGKSGKMSNLKVGLDGLNSIGAEFYETNRGGDITFHGPGQLVVYPVLDLDNFFTDIHKYMRLLEQTVIDTLFQFGISSTRINGLTGVWLSDALKGERKICAMGVKTSRWVTMHGLALNVNVDLDFFNHIIPCGISDKAVTSMKHELAFDISIQEVVEVIIRDFSVNFKAIIEHSSLDTIIKKFLNEK